MDIPKQSHLGAVQSLKNKLIVSKREKQAQVIEYLRRFPFYKWAAAYAGISKDTLEDWRKADEDFSARCEVAKAEAIERLGKRATPDFMLKNVDPETFKDKKEVEVSGDPLVIIKDKT